MTKSMGICVPTARKNEYGFLPVAMTRLPNIFGGGDLNWNRIIPGTIRSAWFGEAPIIYSDGSFIRDYLYVEDAAASRPVHIDI